MDFDLLKEQLEKQIDLMIDDKINDKLGSKHHLKDTDENLCNSDNRIPQSKQQLVSSEREENLIIHGLTEMDEEKSDLNKVGDIFEAIELVSNQ